MKTVMQIVQHLKPGGIETMALDLQKFKADNEEVFIVSLEGNQQQAFENWPKLKDYADQLFFLDKAPGIQLKTLWQLVKLFRKLNVSSVHTHHIGPLIYGGLAARFAGISSIVHTEHDAWHLQNRKRCFVQKCILSCVKPTLIADAETVAKSLKQQLKNITPQVILNGIDTDRFVPGNQQLARDKLGLPAGISLIGTSGRLESVKGQSYLIEAISLLPNRFHLAIAGIGSLADDLKKQAEQLQISHRIHFLGLVDEMPNFYQSLDLFCLPSLAEGMPLSPLEAQACGIRAIATQTGGTHETICSKTGFMIESQSAHAIKHAVLQASIESNPGNPRDFVCQHGDVKKMASCYAQVRATQSEPSPKTAKGVSYDHL